MRLKFVLLHKFSYLNNSYSTSHNYSSETKVPVELALFLQSTMVPYGNFHIEAIVDWRKSASSTGTFVSIIMTGTVVSFLHLDSRREAPLAGGSS